MKKVAFLLRHSVEHVEDIGLWGHWTLGILDLGDIGPWGHWTLGTLDLGDIGPWGYWTLGIFDLGDIGPWGQWADTVNKDGGLQASFITPSMPCLDCRPLT